MSTPDTKPSNDEQATARPADQAPNSGQSATDPAEGSDGTSGELEGSPRG